MKHISELQTTLSDFFDWHKARLNCLVQILQALFTVRTVNLTQIAAAFKTSAKEESSYRVILWGHSLYISVERRKGAKEQMIVVSNVKFESPLALYRRRWEIETLFGCLKGRGFRMEDTHMVDADKIERLLFVLVIGFCWAYRTGDIKAQEIPIEVKAHGRKARSLFRVGLNWIRRAIFRDMNLREFRLVLSCFTRSQPMAYAV